VVTAAADLRNAAALAPTDPLRVYEERLGARTAEVALWTRRGETIANLRLAIFLAFAVLGWLAWREAIALWWLALPLVAFFVLVFRHETVRQGLRRAERGAEHYRRGRARLHGEWAGRGEDGGRFLDLEHPYAADLDLFGPGSLFELLATPRTASGEETLAAWLLHPADAEVIAARQAAVTELQPKLDLKEDLAVLGPDIRRGVDPPHLTRWGSGPLIFRDPGRVRAVALVLAAFGLLTAIGWAKLGMGPWPFVIVMAIKALFERRHRTQTAAVLAAAEHAAAELALLGTLLARLERERPSSPRLTALRQAIATDGLPASARIARLSRWIDLKDSQHNLIFAPLAFILVWPVQVALAIEAWRAEHGRLIGGWLAATGEIEALAAFATYAYENPADTLPEILPMETGPRFAAESLGHPLIPRDRLVRNDVLLSADCRFMVVSGSNMSGKSTLLRAVGTNAVLALAGAPVRAASLGLTPLRVGASVGRHDSLKDGISNFYAEVKHLARLAKLAETPPPLLFLLDELFHGTNSHDRRAGAEGVLRGILARGAIGLVTTHDLALTEAIGEVGAPGANVHFADQVVEGRMAFDYQMRPGVVTRGNALALMRAVGLEV
jgi:hypothetical protein